MSTPTREEIESWLRKKEGTYLLTLQVVPEAGPVFKKVSRKLDMIYAILSLLRTPAPGVPSWVETRACIRPTHEAADAFWKYWRENGETHKHGYYESTWGAINKALNSTGQLTRPDDQPMGEEVTEALERGALCLDHFGEYIVQDEEVTVLYRKHAATLRRMANRGRP